MFALIAAFCFVIAQFENKIGIVNMTLLGLLFVALALVWGWTPWRRPPG